MKNCIILLFFSLFAASFNTSAQKFTLSDLIRIRNYNLSTFETVVNQKGYEFHKIEEDDSSKTFQYSYQRNATDEKATYFIFKIDDKESSEDAIMFQTLSKTDYTSFKNQAIALGYKLDDTFTEGNSIHHSYIKGSIMILLSTTSEKEDGILKTIYLIGIYKL